MTSLDKNDEKILEILYKEYSRLGGLVDQHVCASFSDFRLYGSVAAFAVWYPLANYLKEHLEVSEHALLFGGFTAILVIIGILASRDMYRQSFAYFYLSQMREIEQAINTHVGRDDICAFHFTDDWKQWETKVASIPARPLVSLFLLFVIGFPTAVLSCGSIAYAVSYAAIAIALGLFVRHSQHRFDTERSPHPTTA